MNPTAMASQSGRATCGEAPAGPSRTRQRIQRTGKVSVPRMTAIIRGIGRAARTWVRTSAGLTPLRAHSRSATETRIPTTAASNRRGAAVATAGSGLGKRQGNEVEQLLQQWLKRGEAGVPGELGRDLLPDRISPLQRGVAPVTQSGDQHRWSLRACGLLSLLDSVVDQAPESSRSGGPF